MTEIKYTTLDAATRLGIARDTLRARETDHYRVSLSSAETDPTRDTRLEAMAGEIERLQKEIADLEKEAKA